MLHRLKALVPLAWLVFYHFVFAKLAVFWYGYLFEWMVVIGVMGMNGKMMMVYFF
jgi:hypothetical protein